jgi:hypothetical protein
LAEEFRGRPVVFLSAIQEEAQVVEEFLKGRPIQGWVGIAKRSRLFQEYGIEPVPQTVLIDKAGRVAAVTQPGALNAQVLSDLLDGRPLTVPQQAHSPAMLDIAIRPAWDTSVPGRSKYLTGTLRRMFGSIYRVSEDRIEGEPLAGETEYDFYWSVPGAKLEEIWPLAQQLVAAAFHIQVRREKRDTDVLVLTAPGGKPSKLPEAAPQPFVTLGNRNRYILPGETIESLAQTLQLRMHRPW